jgi:hypothetical protein
MPISSKSLREGGEIIPGCVDVPNWALTGPREKFRQELGNPDGSRGISSERVKSRFFVTLSSKEVFRDAMVFLGGLDQRQPLCGGWSGLPRVAHFLVFLV